MGSRKAVAAAFAGIAVYLFSVNNPAFAGLMGVSSDGTLISIDERTGLETVVGNTGFLNLRSLTADTNGQMFALNTPGGASLPELISINSETGAGSLVSNIRGVANATALAFDGSGTLFAVGSGRLYSVEVSSGQATDRGFTGIGGDILGLDFRSDDTLFAIAQFRFGARVPRLVTIDTVNIGNTLVGEIASRTGDFRSLAFDDNDDLYTIDAILPVGEEDFYSIDPNDASLSFIGNLDLGSNYNGLTYVPDSVASVPEPSSAAILSLLFLGVTLKRRRRTSPQ